MVITESFEVEHWAKNIIAIQRSHSNMPVKEQTKVSVLSESADSFKL